MFTYPVHQAADILFCKATAVPVGKDQLPHLELTRLDRPALQRRYSPASALFPEPDALLSAAPALLGHRRTEDEQEPRQRHRPERVGRRDRAADRARAKTDSERHITYDPVHRPEVSNLVLLAAPVPGPGARGHRRRDRRRRSAALKRLVTEAVNERFRDIRARRAALTAEPGYLREVLRAGNQRAQQIASQTLAEVRQLMHTDYARSPSGR